MGKNFSTIQNFIMNSRDLTLKQMFDVTAQLVGEQEEINNLDNIHWEKKSWRQLSPTELGRKGLRGHDREKLQRL